jgi:sphinganine-1-phosphate aldolase
MEITIPEKAVPSEILFSDMQESRNNDLKWQEGKSFCLIYYPGDEKAELIQKAYNIFFTENAVNPMAFPSLRKFESEVISMVKNLLNGKENSTGCLTSGGTESILMAVKSARDIAVAAKKISSPEIILPVTAHPAFHKACNYFNIKPVIIPVDSNFQADIQAAEKAIGKNTILLVGSAPAYPHGVIDPLEKLSDLALRNNLLLHVDACVGGFFLPFMEKLGYQIPVWDFRLEGVTSISADLHKFGYSAKGASVILYRTRNLRRSQFYIYTGWPGGIYGSSAITGTKPGGAIAAAWAALKGIGMEGYMDMTGKTLEVTLKIRRGIEECGSLKILGEPDMSIIAFTSSDADIYEIADELNSRGWHFERLQNPPAIHLTMSQIHVNSADAFLKDLNVAVEKTKGKNIRRVRTRLQVAAVKNLVRILPPGMIARVQKKLTGGNPLRNERSAPLYGMMGALSGSEDLDNIVLNFLDKLNGD